MTMRTVGWALTWEYWRRGTLWLVLAIAALVIACTGLLYAPLLFITGLHYSDLRAELDTGLVALILLPPLVLATASFVTPQRTYVLPVPTSWLVGCTLANGALAAMCIYWVVTIGLGRLFQATWPLLAPACWTATVYVVLQSLAWQVGRSRGLYLLSLSSFVVFVTPLAIKHLLPQLLQSDDPVAPASYGVLGEALLVLGPTCLLAYFLGVNGVARDRRGDAWSFDWLARGATLLSRVGARRLPIAIWRDKSARAFRSPQAAQFWCEWRTKGRFVLLLVSGTVAGLWVWMTVGGPNLADMDAALGGLSGTFLFLTPFVGLYLGSDAGRFDRRAFAATRPLSDGALAAAVLKNVAAVICSCSAVWLIGIVVALAIYRVHAGDWRHLYHALGWGQLYFARACVVPLAHLLLGVCSYLLGAWTAVGLGASLALARSWFVAVGGCGAAAVLVGFLFSLSQRGLFLLVFPTACLVATLAAFVAAYRRRVISSRMIIMCSAIYILLCIVTISVVAQLRGDSNPLDVYNQFLLAGYCAAPLAPLAAAPWTLSWNRHR